MKGKKITFRDANPEAAKLWIEELNEGITPDTVYAKSGKIVHLRCINNPKHVYSKRIFDIPLTTPYGCPYCQKVHRIAFPGENDLFTLCKEAKEMWDWEKNKNINPYNTLTGSAKKAWFKCEKGHSFSRAIHLFVENQTCPDCRKEKYAVVNYPHMVKQWHFKKNKNFDINMTSATSDKVVWWLCKKCGYEWQAEIATRKISKGLCPCCEHRTVVVKGITDLFTMVPELKQDYDFSKNTNINPDELSVTSNIPVWWLCKKCAYEWQTSPNSRVIATEYGYKIRNCPVCAGTIRNHSYAEDYPDLRMRFDNKANNISLDDLKSTSLNEMFNWICETCNKTFPSTLSAMIRSYDSRYHGCPYCSGKKTERQDSFGFKYPHLMDEFDPDNTCDAFAIPSTSIIEAKWICRRNPKHKWTSSFVKRKGAFGGCPFCEQTKRVLLKEAHPYLERFFDKDKNTICFEKLTYMSNQKLWWRCEKGHSFKRFVYSVSQKDTFFCPICNNIELLKGVNDFASKCPELLDFFDLEKNNFSPDEIRFNDTVTPVWWICIHNHSYQQTIEKRLLSKNCSICSRNIIEPGVNDFLTLCPDIKKIWGPENEKEPQEYSDTTDAFMDFLCKEGHHYKAGAYMVRKYGTDCLVCRNIVLLKGVNSFADKHEELLLEWSPNNKKGPDEFFFNAVTEVTWICKDRELGDDSCPYCSGKRPLAGFNTLDIIKKELIPEWSENNERPMSDFLPTGTTSALWICPTCKGEYSYRIKDREYGDDSCPYCAGKKPLAGYNTLDVIKKELIPEWSENNEHPMSYYLPSSVTSVLWICPTCNGEYPYRIKDREIGDKSCPYCVGRKVLPGYNSFKAKHPDLMEHWDFINNYILADPDKISDKYRKRVWWFCENGKPHKYRMTPRERLLKQKRGMVACTHCRGYRRKRRRFF